MSNISMIIEERPADIGRFLVGRLLPFRGKRMVGPYIFIDHMGPVSLSDHENLDIGPHPHIGLSTLTYLFEGSVLHRDSLGTNMEILPGAVNWMTAGRGIVHSERTPEHMRHSDKSLHGLQIWVALPKTLEQMEPEFHHIPADALPGWTEGSVSYKLIAGSFGQYRSPVPVYSDLFLIELKSTTTETVSIGSRLYGEAGLYILSGGIAAEGISYEPKRILVAKEGGLCEFEILANSTVYIFGGTPFEEERLIYWNFVATSQELIDEAKTKWINQTFDHIEGEEGFIPLPLSHTK